MPSAMKHGPRSFSDRMQGRNSGFRMSRLSWVSGCLIAVAMSLGAQGQAAKVTIDLSKEVNILTSTSLGVPAVMHSGDSFSPAVIPYLRVSGVTTLRYPGNHGIADLYHWESRSVTPYKGAEKPYLAPQSDFASFAQMADKRGGAVIVVNYGTNAKGDGGGDPAEAAAWVAYANGDPADEKPLGKDASGMDWKTVGFWAGMRNGDRLGIDDGYNFLRIGHPKPLNIKLWQVGDQVYNNGFYSAEHAGNADLHGPAPAALKDFGRLHKDPKLSPAAFGANLVEFSKAMKAVDPTINVGAGFPTPPDGDRIYTDFSTTVLKKACPALDFITLDWTPTSLAAPTYKSLDEAETFRSSKEQVGTILTSVLAEYKDGGCPKTHLPRITFSAAGVATWAKPEHPVFPALWIADIYPLLIEAGSPNINWLEMFGSSMISADRKQFGPAYYGLQAIHAAAHNPGDAFVSATSNNPKLAVHATKRRDGLVGVILVNEDLSPVVAQVSVGGASLSASGKRLDYGPSQQAAGAPLAVSEMAGLGKDFNVTVPGYTITVVLIPMAK
jgi:hypothetical protein